MKKKKIFLIFIFLIILIGGFFFFRQAKAPKQEIIELSQPQEGSVVESPLTISGMARGNWFFEASFPIQLVDEQGNLIAQTIAQAQSDWMTSEFVPFSASIDFQTSAVLGYIILRKDNPSGLPENDDFRKIPIKFR